MISHKTPYKIACHSASSARLSRNKPTRNDKEPTMADTMIPILDRGYSPRAFIRSTSKQYELPQKAKLEECQVKPPSSPPLYPLPPPPPPSLVPSRSPSPTRAPSEYTPHPSITTDSASCASELGSIAISERSSGLPRPSRHAHSASDATDSSISTLVSDPQTPLIDPYYSSIESDGWMRSPKATNESSAGVSYGKSKPITTISPGTYFSPVLKTSKNLNLRRHEQPTIRRVPPQLQIVSRPNYPRRKDSLPSATEVGRFSGSTIAPSPVYSHFPKQEPMILEQEPKSAFDDWSDDEPATRYRSFSSSIRLPLRTNTHERPKTPAKRKWHLLRSVFCCGCFAGQ
ncbi:MAG: hypothetical protein M1812_007715 [Candelaria pacifica]|nr:MAG: hypothetical protein M1812_007715 [Candelaria pacifica]